MPDFILAYCRRAAIACLVTPLLVAPLEAQQTRLGPPLHPEAVQALRLEQQAADLAKQGRVAEAEKMYLDALAVFEKHHPDGTDLAATLNNVGNFYLSQQRPVDATPMLVRAHAIFTAKLGYTAFESAKAANNLARAYILQRKPNEAEPLYLQGLAASEKLLGPGHYGTAMTLDDLAQVKFMQGQFPQAEDYLKRALGIAEKAMRPEAPLVVTIMDHMVSVLKAQGRQQEAQALLERAQAIANKLPKKN